MKSMSWSLAAAALVAAACGAASSSTNAPAEQVATLALDAKLKTTFGGVSNVVELADGRIAFADTKARVFLLADLASGALDTVGTRVDTVQPREAPEYKFPGWVAHLAGDTIALVDFAAIRTTFWSEGGEFRRAIQFPPLGGPGPVMVYDQQGHGYKQDIASVLGGGEPGAPVRRDSVAVIRMHVGTGKVDSIAWLSQPDYGEAKFGEQVQQAPVLFGPNDLFGVFPDGAVWVARARQNRVDVRRPDGTWVTGTARPYDKQPVTAADTARTLNQLRGRGMPTGVPVAFPVAEHKPPFVGSMTRPTGEVWLQRPKADESAPATYDVWGRDGKWIRTVALPARSALAGFGREGIFLAVHEADSTRSIARYTLQ